jgi:hypothetical protein
MVAVTVVVKVEYQNRTVLFLVVLVALVVVDLLVPVHLQEIQAVLEIQMLLINHHQFHHKEILVVLLMVDQILTPLVAEAVVPDKQVKMLDPMRVELVVMV